MRARLNTQAIAEEISRRLADAGAPGGVEFPTASYGISVYDAGTSGVDQLIASADAALYKAKSLGRNRAARSDEML